MSSRPHGAAPLLHSVAALERTALSWERTALSLGAVGLLLLKLVDGGWATRGAGILLVVVAGVIVVVAGPLRYWRARARLEAAGSLNAFVAPDRWLRALVLVTAVCISITVVALALDLWLVAPE